MAALFQELQNVAINSRERPKAIDQALVDGCDFPAETPDFNADADVRKKLIKTNIRTYK